MLSGLQKISKYSISRITMVAVALMLGILIRLSCTKSHDIPTPRLIVFRTQTDRAELITDQGPHASGQWSVHVSGGEASEIPLNSDSIRIQDRHKVWDRVFVHGIVVSQSRSLSRAPLRVVPHSLSGPFPIPPVLTSCWIQ